jgi:hypothetical protein
MLKKKKGKKKTNNRLGHDPLHFGGRHGCRSSLFLSLARCWSRNKTLLGEARSPESDAATQREREKEKARASPPAQYCQAPGNGYNVYPPVSQRFMSAGCHIMALPFTLKKNIKAKEEL